MMIHKNITCVYSLESQDYAPMFELVIWKGLLLCMYSITYYIKYVYLVPSSLLRQ